MKMRPSVVLDTGVRTMAPTLVLVSVYLLVVGHNAPGGGFVGGLVAGTALLISFLARGEEGLARLVPAHPVSILGAGLSLALAAGLAGLFAGAAFLDALQATLEIPALGTIKLNTALAFDLGALVLQRLAREEEP